MRRLQPVRVDLPRVPNCITMRSLKPGEIDARTDKSVRGEYANWATHANNPMQEAVTP